MDWIRKLKEEQQEEQQRQDQAYAEALKQASEQKERFQVVKNKLCPMIEAAIVEIKKRTGLELQMDVRDTSLIVKAPHPRPGRFKMDGAWYENYGRISDHHFEISSVSDDGKTVHITAVKAGETNRNPDMWEESELSHADYFGTDETVISTRNDINLLVSEDMHLLFEWLVRLESEKEIAPPELSGMRQRKEQEKAAFLKANLGLASGIAVFFLMFTSPIFLPLGLIAFFLGLRAKKEFSYLDITYEGHGRANWAIGLGILECIIIGISILAMLGAPYRQSIFGKKSLQMRTPVSTSYPVATDAKDKKTVLSQFLKSLKSMVSVEATYSPNRTSPPVRKRYFLK